MSEQRQILTLVSITFIIGLIAITLIEYIPLLTANNEASVEEYIAVFYPNGTLLEEYSYSIRVKKFRMLFRNWNDPLSIEPLKNPYIEPLGIHSPADGIGYLKDHKGSVFIQEPYNEQINVIDSVRSLAELNEVGTYNPDMFEPGNYKVKYEFLIHPPLEYDEEIVHLNIMLADKHMKFEEVQIILEDPEYISDVYPHPPSFKVKNLANRIVIEGSSAENELLEIEMLLDKSALQTFDGFNTKVERVKSKTININRINSIQYFSSIILLNGTRILVLLMPLTLFMLYYIYGREKEYTVPRYLSYVPNKNRKPWIVNQIFKKGALDYDDDGFYATLLDLHMRKKIKIESKPGGLLIKILDQNVEDSYEIQVMRFLEDLSEDRMVDTDKIETYTRKIKNGELSDDLGLLILRSQLIRLTTSIDEGVASKFIVKGKRKMYPLLVTTMLLFITSIIMLTTTPFAISSVVTSLFLSIVALIQLIVAFVFPSTLFGKWKGDAYKEKLEWDSFARHLSDLSQLKKYAPEDISMWGEWLIYGTTLGVADRVVKAMAELDIDIPEMRYVSMMPIYFHPFVVASVPTRSSGRGGFRGGGGFGAGGGFGGGGAGVR